MRRYVLGGAGCTAGTRRSSIFLAFGSSNPPDRALLLSTPRQSESCDPRRISPALLAMSAPGECVEPTSSSIVDAHRDGEIAGPTLSRDAPVTKESLPHCIGPSPCVLHPSPEWIRSEAGTGVTPRCRQKRANWFSPARYS